MTKQENSTAVQNNAAEHRAAEYSAAESGDQAAGRGLVWGVKTSFSSYIGSMSDGDISVLDGADRMPDGSFFFPLAEERAVDGGQVTSFRGAVQFTGHRGMLAVVLSGIQILRDGDQARLSIADDLSPDGRLEMAELSQRQADDSRDERWSATLTEDGADLFFDNYPVGTELEPVRLSL